MRLRPALALGVAVLLAACAKPAPDPVPAAKPAAETPPPAPSSMPRVSGPAQDSTVLQTHIWRLVDARDREGRRIASVLDKPGLKLSMQFDRYRLRIDNACNHIGGDYRYVLVDQLEVLDVQQTLAACSDTRLMAAERDITRMITSASMLSVEQPALRMRLTTLDGDQLWFQGIALPSRR